MRGRCLLSLPVFALLLAVIGCDSFSLLEQFENTAESASQPELKLDLPATNLEQGQTVALIPSGGTPPYSYLSSPGHTQYAGSPGYISNGQFFVAGTSIGTELILLTDSTGKSVSQTVTILPPPPEDFTVIISGPTQNTVTWTYPDLNIITGFKIQRSRDGGAFTEIAASEKNATSYVDPTISNRAKKYTYRMQAVSGSYFSSFTLEQSD